MSTIAPESAAAAPVESPLDRLTARLQTEGGFGRRVRRGVVWAAVSKGGRQATQLLSTVVLARLLLPEEFGLAALVTTVTGFAAIFVELGMGSAIVQARRLSEDLLCTALVTSACAGVVLAAGVAGLAPLLAAQFNEPALTPLLLIAALGFLLQQATVPASLLQRAMRFRTLGWIEIGTSATTVASTIGLALTGAGAVSLVVGALGGGVFATTAYWSVVRWRPRGRVTRTEVRRLVSFSGWITGFNIINYWSRNADNVVVGAVLGFSSLGFYSRAYNLMMMPISQMSGVITRVFFPAYSEIRDDAPRLRDSWLLAVRAALLVGLPVCFGMSVAAGPLVDVLYGAAWAPVAPILAVLAAAVPPQLVGSNTGSLFQALGRTRLYFFLGVSTAVSSLLAMVVGVQWGLLGLSLALLLRAYLSIVINARIACRAIGMSSWTLLAGVAPLLLAAGLMSCAALAAAAVLPPWTPSVLVLVTQALVGAAVYVVVILLVERPLVNRLLPRTRGVVKKKVSQ